jgi:hypothetical protein
MAVLASAQRRVLELLTTVGHVGICSNMKARSLLNQRLAIRENVFVEMRIWAVSAPVRGSEHDFKYALAYVVDGVCVLRFDNEAGNGDHHHIGSTERRYRFTTPERLLADFWKEVDAWTP